MERYHGQRLLSIVRKQSFCQLNGTDSNAYLIRAILMTAVTEREPEVSVRVSAPGEVLSVVPLMLGFQPAQGDLVLLGLDEASRLTVTMRVDAADHVALADEQFPAMMHHLRGAGTCAALLVG